MDKSINNINSSQPMIMLGVENILDKAISRIEDVEYVSDATIMGYLRSARIILECAQKEFFRTHYRFEEIRLAEELENAISQVKQMFFDFAIQCEKKVQEAKEKGKNNG